MQPAFSLRFSEIAFIPVCVTFDRREKAEIMIQNYFMICGFTPATVNRTGLIKPFSSNCKTSIQVSR